MTLSTWQSLSTSTLSRSRAHIVASYSAARHRSKFDSGWGLSTTEGSEPHFCPPPSTGKRYPALRLQTALVGLGIGPLRPLGDRHGPEAIVGLPFHAHREGRGGIGAAGEQFPGAPTSPDVQSRGRPVTRYPGERLCPAGEGDCAAERSATADDVEANPGDVVPAPVTVLATAPL